MTRIVAGTYGGQTLTVPTKGTRPTSERVREALFSKLDHMGMCDDTTVLDLYAGSGALGIEALSRGSCTAHFVEKAAPSARIISNNLHSLGLGARGQVTCADASTFLASRQGEVLGGEVDLVLIDPPYDLPPALVESTLAALGAWLTPDSLVVLESSSRVPLPELPDFLVCEEVKKYGETSIYFLGPPLPAATDHAGDSGTTTQAGEES